MKLKHILYILCFTLFLTACGGQKSLTEPLTLENKHGDEVTFPMDKPVLFFFMTTYT